MSQPISLADLTVANDGPVDPVEYTRRSIIAAKSVQAFAAQTAGPALDQLIELATGPDPVEPAEAKGLAEELTGQAAALEVEVARFTAMSKKT